MENTQLQFVIVRKGELTLKLVHLINGDFRTLTSESF